MPAGWQRHRGEEPVLCSSPTPSLDHEQADGSGYSLRYGAYRSPMMPTDAYWAARARPACSLMEPRNLPRTESAPAQSCRGALEGRGPSTSRKAGTANEITAAVRVLSNHSRGPALRAPRLVRWSLRMSGRRRWNCGGIRASAADSRPPHRVEARQQDRIVAEPAAITFDESISSRPASSWTLIARPRQGPQTSRLYIWPTVSKVRSASVLSSKSARSIRER